MTPPFGIGPVDRGAEARGAGESPGDRRPGAGSRAGLPPADGFTGRDPWRVRAALVTVQLMFGIHYLASKWIVSAIDPAAWAALRVLVSFGILALLSLALRVRLPSRRDVLYLGFCSLFGVVLNQALFLEGIARTVPGHSALINSQIPMFALVAAMLLGQERLTWRKGVGFACGMAGVMVLLEVDRFQLSARYLHGDLLNLANGASYGLFIAMSRPVMARVEPLAAATVLFAFGSLGMLIYGGNELLATDLGALSPLVVGSMAFAVLGATVLTYFLNYWALKRTQASRVAVYVFLQPVVASLLAVWLMGEVITGRFLVATGLVFAALLLRDSPRRARAA